MQGYVREGDRRGETAYVCTLSLSTLSVSAAAIYVGLCRLTRLRLCRLLCDHLSERFRTPCHFFDGAKEQTVIK